MELIGEPVWTTGSPFLQVFINSPLMPNRPILVIGLSGFRSADNEYFSL